MKDMDAHEIPELIEWHEGLLLTPQHFQQLTLRHESLLQYVSTAIAPFSYGVRHLQIDRAALASGVFRVQKLEAVLGDGLVVSFGHRRGGENLQVDLNPFVAQMTDDPVTVYLAVAARQTDALARGDLERYDSVEGDSVADETTGDRALRIPRRRPRLTLLVPKAPQTEPPKNYVSLPLARVSHPDQAFELTEFVPPALTVEPGAPLGVMCAEVVGLLREKTTYLAGMLRNPAPGARAGLDREIEVLVHSLVAALPQLEAVLATGASHPYAVYVALCAVAGQVSTMGRELVPPVFAPYRHDDPHASFAEVITFIKGKIGEAIVSSFSSETFTYLGNGVYSIKFDRAWMDRRLSLGVRGQPGMTEQEVAEWGHECIIASARRMNEMRRNRVPGAYRERIDRDGDLVPTRGTVLFHLQADPEYITPDEDLQIFNVAERGDSHRPAEIILYARNPSQPTHRLHAK
jgi:type VI secretion system protein ImpJ